MKKLLCLVLAIVLVLGCATGCSGGGDSKVDAEWEAYGTPMSDARIRQALNYAINKEAIVAGIYDGNVDAAHSMSTPGMWQPEGLEEYTYNPEKAIELLAEAQWPEDYELDFATYYKDQTSADLMVAIQAMWEEVGVKSQIRIVEGDLPTQLWVAPADKVNGPSEVTWDILFGAVNAMTQSEFYNKFGSEAANNSHTPKNEALDKFINDSKNASVDKQVEAFHGIQEEMNKNANYIPLIHVSAYIITSDRLDTKGAPIGNDQFTYANNILDWTTTNKDGRIYTNGGAEGKYQDPFVNPGLMANNDYVFDRLISANEDLVPSEGLLAESYEVSADGSEFTFVLREDVKWHDGQKFDAEDVAFTIEYSLKVPGANAIMGNTYKAIEGAKEFVDGKADSISGITTEGNVVKIKFADVAPDALTVFSQWPMLPEHILKDSDPLTTATDSFWQHPIGTGPFKVKETVLNSYSILERNDAYFVKGTGNIEEIYMHSSGDSDPNLVKNAEAGLIDYAYCKNSADAAAMDKMSGMKAETISISFTRLLYFNQYPHPSNVK